MCGTLLSIRGLLPQDYYLEDFRNKKVDVYENENHEIILTNCSATIRTKSGENHLKNIVGALDIINNNLVDIDSSRVVSVRYDASTLDYIKNISDVEKHYKDLKVSANIEEKYNIDKKDYDLRLDKGRIEENYKTSNFTSYFNERYINYIVEEDFCTADYYDDSIGRTIINISTYLFNTGNNILTKDNIKPVISKLKEKQVEVLIDRFNEEYLKKLYD